MRYPKTSNYRQNPFGGADDSGGDGANAAMSGMLTIQRRYYMILFIWQTLKVCG